ncbi:DUF6232 family protein [Streptomyces sp. SP18CS02]|uniref:DUF6232 family protein n=1 Tax=Streptomyces sp. SP18CS02 TaxID=3002531 RepID=UPI002E77A35D|nr:DUF6232 family protein [Streptomyces sp. SP18CS02]MEE1756837.1 DUF6232 family protein [Streptomyces sp. SP18CS02]
MNTESTGRPADPPAEPPWVAAAVAGQQQTSPATPPVPSAPPQFAGGIDLRVSKRLLWVGGAAYPLANIARVHTFTLHPRRKDATLLFLKRVAITLSVAIALTVLSGLTAIASREAGGGLLTFVWLCTAGSLVYYIVDLLIVLLAPSHYVLAVETSGPSTAVVTSQNPQHLNQLVGHISHAIENPESEFQVRVDSITISPRNYYFGDNVNMYGGTGNVGMASA